ncbi:MAG TPA: DUF1552 domain-containing protein [Tepidisphaeraceae bacterium]|nr:DUF1552 domain-containing protein [Tepidisphaeraceae bacterium]
MSRITRRTMLRGLGVAMGLPFLDSMVPGTVLNAAQAAGTTAGGAAAVAPTRMAYFFIPNGVNIPYWTPNKEGFDFDLTPTLEPLKAVQKDVMVLSGLTLDNARAKGDGPGDHARSAAAFLTGAHPYKTSGANIKLGVSVDQIAANMIGSQTRLPSLELGLDKGQTAGNCDSGYSCAYVSNISWRSETTPMPKEVDPGSLFDRLFGAGNDKAAAESRAKRYMYRKSILDFVAEDAKRLDRQLGKVDQQKMDEFTTSIREIEKRIVMMQKQEAEQKKPDMARPEGIPGDMTEHMKLMCDLLVLAFQMDITRVSTVMVARDGSDRHYRWLNITEGHHTLSHHGGNAAKIESIRKIDRYHMEQFAYFLQKMKSIKEGSGTLLDHSMIMLGSGISDGDRHNHDELPIVLAGKGGGFIKPGRHIRFPRNTPLCNLYLSMLENMGVKQDRFGDSNGRLSTLML